MALADKRLLLNFQRQDKMAETKEETESNKRVIYTYPMVKQVTGGFLFD